MLDTIEANGREVADALAVVRSLRRYLRTKSAKLRKMGDESNVTEDYRMQGNGKAKGRRPIEREYLSTLNAAVPLDTWQAICKRAAGDAKARDWLAKRLSGPPGAAGPSGGGTRGRA